jgi:beta-aspartyl-peptidase (threonine type)
MAIAIVVHGGAWEIPDRLIDRHERGVVRASRLGHEVLRNGGSALDAVEAAVRDLENDETFDAGRGSFLSRDGVVALDAGVMDGDTMHSGAVASVRGIPNPVTLARRLLEQNAALLLVGKGAEEFAIEVGAETVRHEDMATEAAREFYRTHRSENLRQIFEPLPKGTVGAVALDARGSLAAATSTGGLPGKRRGRVGDSPIVGAGFFAESGAGGASATGHGESILTVGLSRVAVDAMREGKAAPEAARVAADALMHPRIRGAGGLITLDASGRAGHAHTTSRMARAWIDVSGEGALV